MRSRKYRLEFILLALLAILLLGFVGKMDVTDEELKEQLYCANVKSGVWPDFYDKYKLVCEKGANK